MSLQGLTPKCRETLDTMLAMLDGIGFRYMILEGYRSAKKQNAYYAQGRNDLKTVNTLRQNVGLYTINAETNKRIITNCDGYDKKSNHQSGNAVDVVPIVNGKIPWNVEANKALWLQLGETGKLAGFKWGGDWGKTSSKLGWDCPHFELEE